MKNILAAIAILVLSGCETQNPEHFEASFNQEVDRSIFKNYYPRQRNQSISISGNSNTIKPMCPVISEEDRFISIEYLFTEKVNIKDIALLNVFIHQKECINNKCVWKAAVDKYFLPDFYTNKVFIKNYFPKGDYRIWYGYYLKKDSLAEYPRFYKTTCYVTIP